MRCSVTYCPGAHQRMRRKIQCLLEGGFGGLSLSDRSAGSRWQSIAAWKRRRWQVGLDLGSCWSVVKWRASIYMASWLSTCVSWSTVSLWFVSRHCVWVLWPATDLQLNLGFITHGNYLPLEGTPTFFKSTSRQDLTRFRVLPRFEKIVKNGSVVCFVNSKQ